MKKTLIIIVSVLIAITIGLSIYFLNKKPDTPFLQGKITTSPAVHSDNNFGE